MRSLSRLVLIVTCFCLITFAAAQQPLTSSGDLTYDIDSGVLFGIPAGWVLDYSGALPNISLSDNSTTVEMFEPGVIGVAAEDTAGAPLTAILDYLLGRASFTGYPVQTKNTPAGEPVGAWIWRRCGG